MKKESFHNIVSSIQNHTAEEHKQRVLNRTIGRALVNWSDKGEEIWWLVNRTLNSNNNVSYGFDINGNRIYLGTTGVVDTLMNKGKVISKASEFGRQLQNNYSGRFLCSYGGTHLTYDLFNAAHYTHHKDGSITSVSIGNEDGILKYNDLVEAAVLVGKQEERIKEIEEARLRQEELKRDAEQKKKEYEEEQKRLKNEAEKKRLQEEHERIEREREAQLKAAQEREQQLTIEGENVERQLKELSDKYSHSADFIRRQVELKKNPNLSIEQNKIVDGHKFDGVTTIIDGGPGTGKTTTLIQRLSALIQKEILLDYRANHPDVAKYTDSQIDIITSDDGHWMFFSPTELLRQYLQSNMEYEGLPGASQKTFVWEKFLTKALRDNYHLLGDGCPFTNLRRNSYQDSLLKKDLHVVKEFADYFVSSIKERLLQVAELDYSRFSWKIEGKIISDTCREADKKDRIKTISDMYRLLVKLEGLQTQDIQGRQIIDIHTQYGKEIDRFAGICIAQAQKDEELWNNLKKLILTWNRDDEDEDEEADEKETIGDWTQELQKRLKALLRRVALKQLVRQNITGNNALLYDLVKPTMDEDKLVKLGEMAYFNKYFYPVITNAENFLFSKLTKAYRDYRKEVLKQQSVGWNLEILSEIVEKKKNKALHPDEQAFLLGFINNIILSIAKNNPLEFRRMSHKYVEAYRLLCRPVIGIDEATDYTLVDYFAMASLRHYEVSSFTLTGDVMQRLHGNGISQWNELELIFPHVNIQQLNVSYRQSSELLKLAKHLYKATMKEEAPYECFMQDVEGVPVPLWLSSDDEYKKAEWIVARVLEIFRLYGFMPSIAIFVSSDEEARELYENMEEIGLLEENAIKILDCSNGLAMSDTDAVRIFPLDKVKGMEFEAVFFHNIDNLDELASNYLYVGLSRATFYMGVTSHILHDESLMELQSHFAGGDWTLHDMSDTFTIGHEEAKIVIEEPKQTSTMGHCIRCNAEIDLSINAEKPRLYCKDCWRSWHAKGEDKNSPEVYCHSCGEKKYPKYRNTITYNYPLCSDCWKKYNL